MTTERLPAPRDSHPPRSLVTGGAGFVGSTLVDRLLAAGHRVTVVDDMSRGHLRNLPSDHPSLTVHEIDVRDPSLPRLVAAARPEVVFHLAARIDVRASVADPRGDADVNVLGTLAVAEAARHAGARKIVFASSGGAIYGDTAPLPVAESTPVEPLSPYGVAKVSGELYLNALSRLHGLTCTHLAMANIYGPRQDPHGEAGVVAVFIDALLAGRPTRVFGDGGNTRDYVYVGDVAAAFVAAARPVGDRRRFHVGTGVQTSDRQLHGLIAAAVGAPDTPGFAPARLGDLRASALDATAARRDLGWSPRTPLAEGLARTVAARRADLAGVPGGPDGAR
ncbi:NAD-dependent epimerase/dehydratase family protein [Nakamurella deserti]|uniref:NAD-dependent epimerase/dehydratase family protein n=1 Tax=Nakamurella deserti TaxID=2164074 RepID=UPI000DBE458E|nr:NAD-dependent epimerase/dehydratase family protein [Nakamurella deserti]